MIGNRGLLLHVRYVKHTSPAQDEKKNGAHTTNSSLSILFVLCSMSPLLEDIEESLSYSTSAVFPFLISKICQKLQWLLKGQLIAQVAAGPQLG
jgi:hypothetical protein